MDLNDSTSSTENSTEENFETVTSNFNDTYSDFPQGLILTDIFLAFLVVNCVMICVIIICGLLLLQILFSVLRRYCLGKRDKSLATEATARANFWNKGASAVGGWEGWKMPRPSFRKWMSERMNRGRGEVNGDYVVNFESGNGDQVNLGFEGDTDGAGIARRRLRPSRSFESSLDRAEEGERNVGNGNQKPICNAWWAMQPRKDSNKSIESQAKGLGKNILSDDVYMVKAMHW